jgi:hypothetical protein
LHEKYGQKGFLVVAVNGYDESREVIKKFVDEKKLKHLILRSTDLDGDGDEDEKDSIGSAVAYGLGVQGFPTSYWIDARGNIIGREVGFDPSLVPGMERRIEKLLAARAAAAGVKE